MLGARGGLRGRVLIFGWMSPTTCRPMRWFYLFVAGSLLSLCVQILVLPRYMPFAERKNDVDRWVQNLTPSSMETANLRLNPGTMNFDLLRREISSFFDKLETASNVFYLAWSTDESTFLERHASCLESLLLMHPDSTVIIFSNSLPLDFFSDLTERGFKVRIDRMETDVLSKLAEGIPSVQSWLNNLDKWKQYSFQLSTHSLSTGVSGIFRT